MTLFLNFWYLQVEIPHSADKNKHHKKFKKMNLTLPFNKLRFTFKYACLHGEDFLCLESQNKISAAQIFLGLMSTING